MLLTLATASLPLGAVLLFLSSLSLLFKNEGVRGAGRVVSGFGLVLVGLGLTVATAGLAPWAVLAAGVITLGSGARKYLRRNQPQS